MTRLALDQVTDFGDFTRGKDISDYLNQMLMNNSRYGPSDVRLSPDGRHIHIILRKPQCGLMTFDKFQRAQSIQYNKHLDLVLAKTTPIVDVVYIENNGDSGDAVLCVVFENGKTEIWKFLERKSGWHLLQTVDLCHNVKTRVVSVCVCQNYIVWCEERTFSDSSSAPNANYSNFRYYICKRTFEVYEAGIKLGGVKIAMYNNPLYIVISSGENVYLFPEYAKEESSGLVSKFFLAWCPQHDWFRIGSTCSGIFHQKASQVSKEFDFKHLVQDSMGALIEINPVSIQGITSTGQGGLLLLLTSGWVCEVQRDGFLRHIYKLPDNCPVTCSTVSSLSVHHDLLALVVGKMLYLIDMRCGRELERIPLKRHSMLFVNSFESSTPHLLSDAGLFVVMQCAVDSMNKPSPILADTLSSNALLVEAVFEEACKYYQQRSLGSTQLTAEKLQKGGMFQAPLSLAAILKDYMSGQKSCDITKVNGGSEKLLCSLDGELKSLVTMEKVKATLVCASEKELQALGESLVLQEVSRLLSTEVDCDSLIHLNFIFQTFPEEAWHALQAALQLCWNREGSLLSCAPAEVWKGVLTPVQPVSSFHVHTYPHTQHLHQKYTPVNVALPVFELLCHSMFRYQPSWLPCFLELAQQQAGSSASNSGWSYGVVKDSSDSLPLYKRALTVLPGGDDHQGEQLELEVELLLCSQRPNAILQALRLLMDHGEWERVTHVAERFCRQSQLLNKEIFSTMLCEVAHHRYLDPYLDLLWALCPEDATVTSILNTVLKSLPNGPSAEGSPSLSLATSPFSGPSSSQSNQLTVGLLKPLLHRVLLRETKPSQRYADILQSPTIPPPTPPRQIKGLSRAATPSVLKPKHTTPRIASPESAEPQPHSVQSNMVPDTRT